VEHGGTWRNWIRFSWWKISLQPWCCRWCHNVRFIVATVFIHFRNADVDHVDHCSSIMEHVGPRLKIACPIAPLYREANLPSTIWVLGVWISEFLGTETHQVVLLCWE
jgi:hypothetical protein